MESRVVLQMDQAASGDQSVLRHFGERGEDAGVDRHLGLSVGGHCEEAADATGYASHDITSFQFFTFRENARPASICRLSKKISENDIYNQLKLFNLRWGTTDTLPK